MKANEFIRKFGWNDARVCILNCASPADKWFIHCGVLISDKDFDDLKRLVESHELVESFSIIGLCAPENNYNQCLDYEKFGGLPMAKRELAEAIEYNSEFIEVILDNEITLIETERLKQAIALVEEI